MSRNFTMLAKTLFGFESLLEKELKDLGAMNVKMVTRGCTFEGDAGFMYKANLCLHTAIKILKPIKKFKVRNEEELYKNVKQIPWEHFLEVEGSLAVTSTVFSTRFTHSQFIALKTKDAIVDRFRESFSKRPSVDLKHPNLSINVHIQEDFCTISLDSSGASLHHRGYRSAVNMAPMNEVLAAGLVLMSGWDATTDMLDPMCGSGTMLIEAAMIANKIPANINRNEFGFEKWKDFDEALYEKIKESSLKKIIDCGVKFYGMDKAPSAVRKAQDNVRNANLEDFITIERGNFFFEDGREDVTLLFNPPYGERLEIDVEEVYSKIGDTLKQQYSGCDAWLITSDMDAIKNVGLRASRKIKVFNGKLESRWVKYEMYRGTKKLHKVDIDGEETKDGKKKPKAYKPKRTFKNKDRDPNLPDPSMIGHKKEAEAPVERPKKDRPRREPKRRSDEYEIGKQEDFLESPEGVTPKSGRTPKKTW